MEALEQTQTFWNIIESDVRAGITQENPYADIQGARKILESTRQTMQRWATRDERPLNKMESFLQTYGPLFTAIRGSNSLTNTEMEQLAKFKLLQSQNLLDQNPYDSFPDLQTIARTSLQGFRTGGKDSNLLFELETKTFPDYFTSVWNEQFLTGLRPYEKKRVETTVQGLVHAIEKNPAVLSFLRGDTIPTNP